MPNSCGNIPMQIPMTMTMPMNMPMSMPINMPLNMNNPLNLNMPLNMPMNRNIFHQNPNFMVNINNDITNIQEINNNIIKDNDKENENLNQFTLKLNSDILAYSEEVIQRTNILRPFKMFILDYLVKLLKCSTSKFYL
jgi:hypothetical protein